MAGKRERGLWELYTKDPEKADAEIWDRKPKPLSRRGFLKKTGLATMALAIGSQIPFFRNMPGGFIPLALAETDKKRIIKTEKNIIDVPKVEETIKLAADTKTKSITITTIAIVIR